MLVLSLVTAWLVQPGWLRGWVLGSVLIASPPFALAVPRGRYVSDLDDPQRRGAVLALFYYGGVPAEAVPKLLAIAGSSDPDAPRTGAIRALAATAARWDPGWGRSIGVVRVLTDVAAEGNDVNLRISALRALADIARSRRSLIAPAERSRLEGLALLSGDGRVRRGAQDVLARLERAE